MFCTFVVFLKFCNECVVLAKVGEPAGQPSHITITALWAFCTPTTTHHSVAIHKASKMPDHLPKDHSQMQESVCFVCWTKPAKKLERPFRRISDTIARQIKDNQVLADYGEFGDDGKFVMNPRWAWLPTVVCDSCRKMLRDGSQVYFAGLKRGPYKDLRAPRAMTRACGGVCDCSCCLRGRVNIPNNKKALEAYDAKQRVGRPSTSCDESSPEAGPQIVQVCTECWIQVSPGVHHPCTKTSLKENLLNILEQAPQKTKEQVLTTGLKGVFAQEGASTKGDSVSLSTGGKRMTVTLGKKSTCPPPFFSLETLNRLQLKLRVSDRKIRTVAAYLRIHAGRRSVEANQEMFLIERNNRLQGFFRYQKILMTEFYIPEGGTKKDKTTRQVEVPVGYCHEVEGLAHEVILGRELDPDTVMGQIGVDDGGLQMVPWYYL